MSPGSLTGGGRAWLAVTGFANNSTIRVSVTGHPDFVVTTATGALPVGALVNPDNSLNGPANPLARGKALVIYCTGLGAATASGQLSVVSTPLTVVLNGTPLPALFAGLTPGYIGLYQVNVIIPAATPPGLGITLTLKQGEQFSNRWLSRQKMRAFGVKLLTRGVHT